MEDKWREKAAYRKTSGGRRLLIGAVEDQWREKGDDREQWKTSGGRRLLIGAVEDKWREKGADKSSGRQVEGEGC